MGNTPSTRIPSSSNRGFASTISSTFSRHKTDVEHSQSTTAVQFQKDLLRHQKEEEEYEYLTKLTTFDSHTLRLLKGRFDTIDQTIQKDGQISIDEFAQVLEMDSKSILLRRFFKFMDKSSMGSLNFRNFVTALSLLSIDAPDEDKIKLSFFLYDINDDKQIDREECTKMVKLALNEINMQLSTKQIQVIVNNTFREADMNNDGVIDYEEYKIYCKKNPRVLEPFKVDISSLVLDEQENRRGRRMSGPKALRHWPTDQKKKNKMIRKIKKSVPKYMKREKIERVRSIHHAKDITDALDDDKNDDIWDEQHDDDDNNHSLPSVKDLSKKASSSRKNNKHKKKRSKGRKKKHSSKSMDGESDNDEKKHNFHDSMSDDENDGNDGNYDGQFTLPKSPGSARKLKVALSADSADRRKKKKEKYSKSNKKKKTKKRTKQQQKNDKIDNDNDNDKHEGNKEEQEDDKFVGLNTSVPKTPPKTKTKPTIKQSDLDAIDRLLSD
eukprot:CAMPEP_0201582968 /NCGR_PEP_ID=MMETSP0190_2-20130828/92756_1 /ASSEMBLY_ACC=CAM_ASM_000263 /TAXON_ID=37353 /ORGANISM="Rosalina sp." /LENGTH=495 /DNA_ID=CAMNT_0048023961 /DNA_START=18 /DNA_END=1505 /DNA_ORIENTATION=+